MKPLSAAFQAPDARSSAPSFGAVMREAVDSTNRLQEQADREIQALAVGKNGDLHKTMIAMEEAGVSFSLLMQVRNRIVAAYQEIMRMQI
ncbi:MAG: flagellar hook-basal body complex protein FliE [Deltaproteobacteria bacterium]|nr:flagellar hook-basal body complex protein FliE [Deltaproteobacteria bacterium]